MMSPPWIRGFLSGAKAQAAWPVALLCFVLAPSPGFCAGIDVRWVLDLQRGNAHLAGYPVASEADTVLWASCKKRGVVEVGIGAYYQLQPRIKRLNVSVQSKDKIRLLSGNLVRSQNFEMTGGRELRVSLAANDKLFEVLSAGAPIVFKTPFSSSTWSVSDLQNKVDAFVHECQLKPAIAK